MRWCARLALVAVCFAASACGGSHHSGATTSSATTSSATTSSAEGGGGLANPRLTRPHRCPGESGFTCATLVVPLDHGGQATGSLRLAVGYASNAAAPHGVLVFLSGGPGQPGIPFLARVQSRLGSDMRGYRLVMFDQRGTGAGALRCPVLQAVAGASDLVVPPPGAIQGCARSIGPSQRYYTTSETAADIDALRKAFGVSKLTLDGVSYGTFVAERYALAYPQQVARLVLDSVVPQEGVDATYLAALQATARVLRSACAEQHCGFDPVRDVATIVRTQRDGPELLDTLVAESVGFPSFAGVLGALHAAARGDLGPLNRFFVAVHRGDTAPAAILSQGLHESALCAELAPSWDPASSSAARTLTVTRAVAHLRRDELYPWDRATALGNGLAVGCEQWPATKPPAVPTGNVSGDLPRVPVLLFSGERDLSTPLAWGRAEAAKAPEGRLVVVPRAGHSVQLRSTNAGAREVLAQFLAG
ncbi:MAG: alpha/beta fold hydrolase [Solirubrobacteraceae bacterium]